MSVEARDELAVGSAIVRVSHSGHTDRGPLRRHNEDSFLASPPFWLVADGMGGHAHGDLASQAAVAAFARAREESPLDARAVLDALREANAAVRGLPGERLSGTTLSGVAVVELDGGGPHWMAFNVGDSRTYLWDGRRLEQQSVDHSAVQELIDAGSLTAAEAASHPQRNVVTRALGAEDEVEADIWLLPVRGRQTFLLCTDGLTKELDDDEIARIIVFHDQQSGRDEEGPTLAERLVGAAVAAGGRDNVTVVVVESELVGDPVPDPDDTIDRNLSLLEDTLPRS